MKIAQTKFLFGLGLWMGVGLSLFSSNMQRPEVAFAQQPPAAKDKFYFLPLVFVFPKIEPYNQGSGLTFQPRNGLDYDPLMLGEVTIAQWEIMGATKAELEIVGIASPNIFNCPTGDTASVSSPFTAGQKQVVTLPTGQYAFSISKKGYYLVTLYVTKTDGSMTTIPRGITVDCYKKPGV